jgi:hypothetical protein
VDSCIFSVINSYVEPKPDFCAVLYILLMYTIATTLPEHYTCNCLLYLSYFQLTFLFGSVLLVSLMYLELMQLVFTEIGISLWPIYFFWNCPQPFELHLLWMCVSSQFLLYIHTAMTICLQINFLEALGFFLIHHYMFILIRTNWNLPINPVGSPSNFSTHTE